MDHLVTRDYGCTDFESVVQSKTQNVFVALISDSCGTCQILARLLVQLRLYLAERLSPENQRRVRFLVLNVSKNRLPVTLNFEKYPQLLAYPKPEKHKTTKSLSFDMTKSLDFRTLLLWVLSYLGLRFLESKDIFCAFAPAEKLEVDHHNF